MSTWLNAGVDPAEVAGRVGNSVEVLLTAMRIASTGGGTSPTGVTEAPGTFSGACLDRWKVESLHHVRDSTFAEDASQRRTGNAPRTMATWRNLALGTLNLNGVKKAQISLNSNACRQAPWKDHFRRQQELTQKDRERSP